MRACAGVGACVRVGKRARVGVHALCLGVGGERKLHAPVCVLGVCACLCVCNV